MTRRRIRRSTIALVAGAMATVLIPTAAGAAPGDRGPASEAAPQATLVRTHVFLPAPAPARSGGKPQPAANCSPEPTTALSGDWQRTGFTATTGEARVNASTIPPKIATGAINAISSAFAEWKSANTQAPTFTVTDTGDVTKETANGHTDVLFGRTPGNAIAVTYTWHWSTGAYESDTVFSNRVPWAIITNLASGGCNTDVAAYDLQDIATHEFGHIYGLDHATGDSRWDTMYAYGYTGETVKRTLNTSDTTGIDTLYP